jgi:hypothetical protein
MTNEAPPHSTRCTPPQRPVGVGENHRSPAGRAMSTGRELHIYRGGSGAIVQPVQNRYACDAGARSWGRDVGSVTVAEG